ncbi:MAG: hypothetical protein R3321_10030, partial [Nitrososphaeraceae archaeon]|nr:hypothetical protein [Nitrososphaeraceae archaeon]
MRLEILIGLPGSGKSKYARDKAEKGYIIVDADSLVYMTNGGVYNFIESRRSLYGGMVTALV